MSDPRLTPANGRIAAAHLRGQVAAERFVDGAARQLTVPLADVRHAPDGDRLRQWLAGTRVTVFEERDGWAFAQDSDGYVGYVPVEAIGPAAPLDAVVTARATHAYSMADIKSPGRATLSFGAWVGVTDRRDGFLDTPYGFVPEAATKCAPTDPLAAAERLLGTPYLWGGNSSAGIDCSGLVQIACHVCGMPCPGDSDMQQSLGAPVEMDAPLRRNDLLFWRGHVAWVADPDTILHANAHHMAVAFEPLSEAVDRISAAGDGGIVARRRLTQKDPSHD